MVSWNRHGQAYITPPPPLLHAQYHPDVSKGNTELQFLQLAEAYAQLINGLSSHNADGSARPGNSEAFHDWCAEDWLLTVANCAVAVTALAILLAGPAC